MSAHMVSVIEALRGRAQRISPGNGFYTQAGQRVYIGRVHFSAMQDTFPLITFGVPRSVPDRIITATQTYTADRFIQAVGYIHVPVDDWSSNAITLQDDMEKALLSTYSGDVLPALVEDLEWTESVIEYPQEPADFTRVAVTVRVRVTEQQSITAP